MILHHISRDSQPIRYHWPTPHRHCPTGMNRKAPKPDLCISTTSTIICCEHLPSNSNLQSYKNCGRQPRTPLHKAPPFPTPNPFLLPELPSKVKLSSTVKLDSFTFSELEVSNHISLLLLGSYEVRLEPRNAFERIYILIITDYLPYMSDL